MLPLLEKDSGKIERIEVFIIETAAYITPRQTMEIIGCLKGIHKTAAETVQTINPKKETLFSFLPQS